MTYSISIARDRFILPAAVFISTSVLLAFVQLKVENPMLLAERFFRGSGWIEILLISCYGALVIFYMQDPSNVPKWRKITWTAFTIVFFSQLAIGLAGVDKFLMTGKLHLPIPMMILGGPVYRGELSVMTILFISTVVLTGPAWCSHFCYFGALDNIASSGKTDKTVIRNKSAIKYTVVLIVVAVAIILRWMEVPALASTLTALAFGLIGIAVMIFLSRRKHKMVHCTAYCPIGTIVNLTRYVNPFRIYIDSSCTSCMKCTTYCKYDSLSVANIRNRKPGAGCTLCGDCLAGCHHGSLKYRFLRLKPGHARNLYLILTITIHATCMALARI